MKIYTVLTMDTMNGNPSVDTFTTERAAREQLAAQYREMLAEASIEESECTAPAPLDMPCNGGGVYALDEYWVPDVGEGYLFETEAQS